MTFDAMAPYGELRETTVPHGVGHPVHAEVIGSTPVDGLFASDHFGLFADLRY